MFKVFIVNADRFNACTDEGKVATDFGAWFELPIVPNEFGKIICETIGSVTTSDGYKLTECETPLEELDYGMFDIWQANLDAITLEDYYLDDSQRFIVNALLSEDNDLEDSLAKMYRGKIYDDCDDEASFGRRVAEEEGLEIDCELEEYVRWEDFVYDRFYGDYIFYEYCCVAFN